jgi:hypothetical protein
LVGAGNDADAPACVTVNVRPPIMSVLMRDDVLVLAPTVKATVPLPVPVAPAVIVIQPALLVAVHAHPVPAVILTLPVPPAADTDRLAGVIAYVQPAPPCVRVNVRPPAVTVPVRDDVLLLGVTR